MGVEGGRVGGRMGGGKVGEVGEVGGRVGGGQVPVAWTKTLCYLVQQPAVAEKICLHVTCEQQSPRVAKAESTPRILVPLNSFSRSTAVWCLLLGHVF